MASHGTIPLRQRRCVAIRRKDGKPCQRPITAGDKCWVHGGAATGRAGNRLSVTLDGGVPIIWHSDEAGTKLGSPRAVSKWGAVEFIKRGIVKNGFFLVADYYQRIVVEKFIRRIERSGARCIPLPSKGPVCHYRFEAPESQEESQT